MKEEILKKSRKYKKIKIRGKEEEEEKTKSRECGMITRW